MTREEMDKIACDTLHSRPPVHDQPQGLGTGPMGYLRPCNYQELWELVASGKEWDLPNSRETRFDGIPLYG